MSSSVVAPIFLRPKGQQVIISGHEHEHGFCYREPWTINVVNSIVLVDSTVSIISIHNKPKVWILKLCMVIVHIIVTCKGEIIYNATMIKSHLDYRHTVCHSWWTRHFLLWKPDIWQLTLPQGNSVWIRQVQDSVCSRMLKRSQLLHNSFYFTIPPKVGIKQSFFY